MVLSFMDLTFLRETKKKERGICVWRGGDNK